MANIGVGELSTAIATIIAAQALGYLKANVVAAQVINRDFDNEVAVHGQVVDINFRGALTANAKAADTATTKQTPSTTAVSVTLDQHFEVTFILEDIGKALARPEIMEGYIEDGIKVLAEKIDATVTALHSGFSQTITATTGLGEDDFREGRRLLNAAKAPLTDRWAILHEDAEKEALGIEKLVNRDYRGDQANQALSDGFLGRFSGFNVVMSQNITVATTVKNLFIHKNAAVLVMRPLPPPPEGTGIIFTVMTEDGFGIRVMIGYNLDHLGVQVTLDALWGVSELRDDHGVVVVTTEV